MDFINVTQSTKYKVSNAIVNRLYSRHKINLISHINKITWMSDKLGEGFKFTVKDWKAWEMALVEAGFNLDDKNLSAGNLLPIGFAASYFTDGKAYRESGSPSLHCAIDGYSCGIHLDNYGFRCNNSYDINLVQHTVDELGW